ncbi:hypothetical protein SDC9_86972 [bioreactor metagenome]|uniref:Uncharacterized protein n=1 Tax=bioreactor metagenome TaxID=1076179 RepID=A0A644ZHF4_9ZZZZ
MGPNKTGNTPIISINKAIRYSGAALMRLSLTGAKGFDERGLPRNTTPNAFVKQINAKPPINTNPKIAKSIKSINKKLLDINPLNRPL